MPFLFDFFRSNRETLLALLSTLNLQSSTQDTTLLKAISFILDKKNEKSEYISDHIDGALAAKVRALTKSNLLLFALIFNSGANNLCLQN